MNKIKIHNAEVITPDSVLHGGTVFIEDSKIASVTDKAVETEDYLEIDAGGNYVSHGFIDIHTHGGGGSDFMDGTVEAYLQAAEAHARHGTTSLLPTTLTSTDMELKRTFEVYREAKKQNKRGAELLGIHLEGPYFSLSQKGAQDPRYIKNPKPEEYMEILGWSDDILRWSAAPELEGALEFGRVLRERGILPSIAHSDAIDEEVFKAFDNGFTHVTHLYSGMSGVKRINAYRFAGVIETALLMDDMTVEIIADGVHLPATLLKLIYKVKGPDRIALVTDSMRAAGMPEGESILGSLKDGQRVIVEDGVAKLPDKTAFAGSVATADRLIRTMTEYAGVPLVNAVKMMTATPASIIGAGDKKGSLIPGRDADVIIFDKGVEVKMTMISGNIVYES